MSFVVGIAERAGSSAHDGFLMLAWRLGNQHCFCLLLACPLSLSLRIFQKKRRQSFRVVNLTRRGEVTPKFGAAQLIAAASVKWLVVFASQPHSSECSRPSSRATNC